MGKVDKIKIIYSQKTSNGVLIDEIFKSVTIYKTRITYFRENISEKKLPFGRNPEDLLINYKIKNNNSGKEWVSKLFKSAGELKNVSHYYNNFFKDNYTDFILIINPTRYKKEFRIDSYSSINDSKIIEVAELAKKAAYYCAPELLKKDLNFFDKNKEKEKYIFNDVNLD